MRVLLCIVSYKSDGPLANFLRSIQKAVLAGPRKTTVTVLVIDNSLRRSDEKDRFLALVECEFPGCEVTFPSENLGYFGALPIAQARQADLAASVVIFCNADILLADNFFTELAALSGTHAAVIAPAIISGLGSGFDQNPKHVDRVTAKKLRTLQLIYSRRITFHIQQFLGSLKELIRQSRRGPPAKPDNSSPETIYAPHGALFIFTDVGFFMNLPKHEPFLFGEELFIAEEALQAGKTIIYSPQLRVLDSRHTSTGILSTSRRRVMMKDSVDFILRKYHSS